MRVLVTRTNGYKTTTNEMELDTLTDAMVGKVATEEIILLRHIVLDGGMYERGKRGVRVTVQPAVNIQ